MTIMEMQIVFWAIIVLLVLLMIIAGISGSHRPDDTPDWTTTKNGQGPRGYDEGRWNR